MTKQQKILSATSMVANFLNLDVVCLSKNNTLLLIKDTTNTNYVVDLEDSSCAEIILDIPFKTVMSKKIEGLIKEQLLFENTEGVELSKTNQQYVIELLSHRVAELDKVAELGGNDPIIQDTISYKENRDIAKELKRLINLLESGKTNTE